MGRAVALEALGRFDESIDQLRAVVARDPAGAGPRALFLIGNCQRELGQLALAVEAYDQSLAENDSSSSAWHNRASALLQLGQLDAAAGSYARASDLDPENVGTCLWQGYCLRSLGRGAEADACFQRAIRTNAPEDVAQAWMQIGSHLHTAGSLEDALDAYERARALRPDWDVVWVRRGVALAQLGRDEAADAFTKAIALDGSFRLSALVNLAALRGRQGRRREASAIYGQALETSPTVGWHHIDRAQALLALGRPEEALASVAAADRLQPGDRHGQLLRGICLDALDRIEEAAAAFEALTRIEPQHAEAWRRRGDCLLEVGQYDTAESCISKAMALGDASPRTDFLHARALAALGRFDEAVAACERAAAKDPTLDGAWVLMGLSYQRLQRHAEAVDGFDRALQIVPTAGTALRGVAQSLEAMGKENESNSWAALGFGLSMLDSDPAQAVAHIIQAFQLSSDNWLAARCLGDFRFQRDELNEAVTMYQRSLVLRPKLALIWNTLGAVLRRLDRGDEATSCFKRALEADPRSASVLRNVGIDLLEHGDPAEALARFERALLFEPDNANGWYGKGVALTRLKRLPDAVAAFRNAVAIAPDDVEAWRDLGTCLTFLTRYREASDAWAQLDRLRPDTDSVAEVREALSGFGKVLPNVWIEDPDTSSVPEVATAYVCMRRGDYVGAAAAFDRALALDPNRVDLLADRGICAEVLEGPEQALPFFDRAQALSPDDVRTWYNRGVSLMNLQRTEEAAAAFEQAVKHHEAHGLPPDADLIHAHHNLGSCLMLLKRSEDALDSFDEVALLARHALGEWQEEARRAEELKRLLFRVGR